MLDAADRLSDGKDEVNASLRQLEATENQGKPKLRVINRNKVL